jgi:hypothetical protein
MEIEELTKSQIILLVLLVSFVTSIATGIVTVSLLAQTPPAITQTINRIVERTVETVVSNENQTASVVTKETTVVVKEDDLIAESINTGFSQVARIYEGVATSTAIIALGAVTGNGTIVTDLSRVSNTHTVLIGGSHYTYMVSKKIPELGIAFMSATGTAPTVNAFKGVGVDSVKLGHTVIGLYGARSDRVAMSIASAFSQAANIKVGDTTIPVRFVETTISDSLTAGTPLISIFGDLVGVSTNVSRADGPGSFISFGDITNVLTAETKKKESENTPSTSE